jgi:RNA polymerase sigma-70 factor (ECF subfamily)
MMKKRRGPAPLAEGAAQKVARNAVDAGPHPEQRISDREEVERLLEGLGDGESRIVRMYHLEGKSYQEISRAVGISENSVGPILSRARKKLQNARVDSASR